VDDHGRDLLAREFWDANWSTARKHSYHRWNYYHRSQSRFLKSLLPPGGRFLELGCAESIWLEHLRDYCEVWGIDYSPTALARMAGDPRLDGVKLVLGDMFDADNNVPRDYFDVVFSEGVLEHFSDPGAALRLMRRYARPGGIIATSIPNVSGLVGKLQRMVDRELFEAHVLYEPKTLDWAHISAGLVPVVPARYWGHVSIGAVNYSRLLLSWPRVASRAFLLAVVGFQQVAAWFLSLIHARELRTIAPHLRGAYRRAGPDTTDGPAQGIAP
jgi:SAM-dependent methyltransferase